MRYTRTWWLAGLIMTLALTGGCISNQDKINAAVDDGEVALGGDRYDVAVEKADEAIKVAPNPKGYYLRGRAEEDRPKPDQLITQSDLDKAKSDYQAALDLHPGEPLESRCHSGLANIAFGQDDYQTAIYHWTTALDGLDQPDWRAYALYRIGECQQRLGHFEDADKTFARVCQEYPDQDVAAKAQARESVRGFYVQIGAFANPDDAAANVKIAKSIGMVCHEVPEQGMITVRGGPYSTYTEAIKAKTAVASQFPDAVVGP